MKFTIKMIDPFAEDINASVTDVHFLRTLNTEKTFRDETGAELQAQLTTLYRIQSELENDPENPDKIAARMDYQFAETRHEVLKYMYAEQKDGTLVQSEITRQHFEELDNLDEMQALAQFFRNV